MSTISVLDSGQVSHPQMDNGGYLKLGVLIHFRDTDKPLHSLTPLRLLSVPRCNDILCIYGDTPKNSPHYTTGKYFSKQYTVTTIEHFIYNDRAIIRVSGIYQNTMYDNFLPPPLE